MVWATRRQRPGDAAHVGFAAIYYWIMRHVVGMKEIPENGADFFLIDRVVIDAFRRCQERHVSVFALIAWLGFKQEYIEYDKQPRAAGRSGWTMARKIKLVVDSVTGFSDAPIKACSILGGSLLAIGLLLAVVGLFSGVLALILALIVGLAGLQLLALGVVGEYVWRALDESRRRPAFLIEAVTGPAGSSESRSPASI